MNRFEFLFDTLILFEHHDDFRKTIAMNIADELRLVVSDSDSEARVYGNAGGSLC